MSKEQDSIYVTCDIMTSGFTLQSPDCIKDYDILKVNERKLGGVSEAKPRIFYGLVIAIAAFFILFASYGVRFAYGVFFSPMANDLGFDSATTSAAYSISFLLEGVFSLISGGLADRFGPRIVLTLSTILVAGGYCLMALINTTWQLYLVYGVIIGIGMGAMFVPLVSMTARWFNARRNLMTGLVSSGAGFGMLIVPPSAARLIELHDWRYSFIVLGLIILVVVLLASQFLKRDPSKMGTVAYGEKPQTHTGTPAPVAGYTFKQAIKTSQFWIIFVMIFWYGVYSMSYNVHIVPDAINSGMASTTAASILSTSGGLLILGRVILGNLADKIGNKPIFILGFILSTIAMLSISVSQAHWMFFLLAVLIGFSQGGLGTSQSPIVASLFGLKNHGLIFGCVGFGFTIGAALGPYFTGLIFDTTGSYHIAFLVCAGTSIAAIFFALLIKPIKGVALKARKI